MHTVSIWEIVVPFPSVNFNWTPVIFARAAKKVLYCQYGAKPMVLPTPPSTVSF